MSISNECTPFFEEADRVTAFCTANVIGKRFLKISGNRQTNNEFSVAQLDGPTVPKFGVAAYDMSSGSRVEVIRQKGIILPVTSGAAGLAAGIDLMSDASGRVVAWVFAANNANIKIGQLLDGVTNIGDDAIIELY